MPWSNNGRKNLRGIRKIIEMISIYVQSAGMETSRFERRLFAFVRDFSSDRVTKNQRRPLIQLLISSGDPEQCSSSCSAVACPHLVPDDHDFRTCGPHAISAEVRLTVLAMRAHVLLD